MNTRKEIPYGIQSRNQFIKQHFKACLVGLSTLNTVRERGGIDTLTTICEDLFSGNTPTDTQINDWLWFDTDFIYQALGYEDLLEG